MRQQKNKSPLGNLHLEISLAVEALGLHIAFLATRVLDA